MWLYKEENVVILEGSIKKITEYMNEFGEDNWEIFSVTEKIETYNFYGNPKTDIYYKLFMKKFIPDGELSY